MSGNIVPSQGFIGFFDILGYRQLLVRNEIPRVVELLERHLGQLPNFGDKMFGRPAAQFKDPEIGQVIASLQWLSFADSILLALPITHSKHLGHLQQQAAEAVALHQRIEAAVYLSAVSRFLFVMFHSGLPLRGAIQYGDFYIDGRVFAGRSISDAYELAAKQEWSGCALTRVASDNVESILKVENPEWFEHILPKYHVPCKGGEIFETRAVNWGFWAPWNFDFVEEVLREAVLESFLKHNKVLHERDLPKVGNTEIFLNVGRASAQVMNPRPWTPLIRASQLL